MQGAIKLGIIINCLVVVNHFHWLLRLLDTALISVVRSLLTHPESLHCWVVKNKPFTWWNDPQLAIILWVVLSLLGCTLTVDA